MTEKDDEEFTEDERITANLRLGSDSIPAVNRTLLGLFAFIPPSWRGPTICFGMAIVGYLLGSNGANIIGWIKSVGSP